MSWFTMLNVERNFAAKLDNIQHKIHYTMSIRTMQCFYYLKHVDIKQKVHNKALTHQLLSRLCIFIYFTQKHRKNNTGMQNHCKIRIVKL